MCIQNLEFATFVVEDYQGDTKIENIINLNKIQQNMRND